MSINQPFVIPDIHVNSKIFNPHKRKGKVEEAAQLRDLKYQYFIKHEEDRKAFRAQRQYQSKDTQIKFSQNRDSAAFLLLFKKTSNLSPNVNKNLDFEEPESNYLEQELIRQKLMTVDELINEFGQENEDQVRSFSFQRQGNASSLGPNQGIGGVIDKTFSKVEVEKTMTKNQKILAKAKRTLINRKQLSSKANGHQTANQIEPPKILKKQNIIENWQTQKLAYFEDKLRQAIIDRIEDKSKIINNCDINQLVNCLKESKMSMENELDDLKLIKSEMEQLNNLSQIDADKIEKKVNLIMHKIQRMSIMTQEQSYKPQVKEVFSFKHRSKSQLKTNDHINKSFQKNKVHNHHKYSQGILLKQRDTNKHLSIKEHLEQEGMKEGDLHIRQEFIKLRGGQGLKKSMLEQELDQEQEEYYERILNKKQDSHETHQYFVSKQTQEENEKRKQRKLQMSCGSQQDDDMVSIPDSPIFSQLHYQKQEYIKTLKEKQDRQRRSQSEKKAFALNSSIQSQTQRKAKQTSITAQRFFMGQQILKQQKNDKMKQTESDNNFNNNQTGTQEKLQTMQSTTIKSQANENIKNKETIGFVNDNDQSKLAKAKENNEECASNQSYLKNNSCQLDDSLTISPYSIRVKTFTTSKKDFTTNTQSNTTLTNSKAFGQRVKSIESNPHRYRQNAGPMTNQHKIQLIQCLKGSKEDAISESYNYDDIEAIGDVVIMEDKKKLSRPQTSQANRPPVKAGLPCSRMNMSGGFRRPFSSYKKQAFN